MAEQDWPRCWWCGTEPVDCDQLWTFGVDKPTGIRWHWPAAPSDHVHAVDRPSPEELTRRGFECVTAIGEIWADAVAEPAAKDLEPARPASPPTRRKQLVLGYVSVGCTLVVGIDAVHMALTGYYGLHWWGMAAAVGVALAYTARRRSRSPRRYEAGRVGVAISGGVSR